MSVENPVPYSECPQQRLSATVTDTQATSETSRHQGIGRRIYSASMLGVRAVQTAIVLAEVSPANEAARYTAFGYTQFETGSPALAATAFAATTLAVEGSSALAAAGLIDSDGGKKMFGWIDKKTNGRLQRSTEEDPRITPVVEASLAMFVGTPAVLAAKQIEDTTRTLQENRKHGLVVASAMSGYFALEGYAASYMTQDIDNPYLSTGASLAGAIGLTVAGSWIHKRYKMWRTSRRGE